jgi:hypothetical protein
MELREALAMHPALLPSSRDRRDDGVGTDEGEAVAVAARKATRSNRWPISGQNDGADGHASTPLGN